MEIPGKMELSLPALCCLKMCAAYFGAPASIDVPPKNCGYSSYSYSHSPNDPVQVSR